MIEKKIIPDFGNCSSLPKNATPDSFIIGSKKINHPKKEHVISRNSKGEVLSTYGDETWDLRPFRLAGEIESARIHFKKFPPSKQEEIRWLIFLVMYTSTSNRSAGLSVSSIMSYLKLLRNIAGYSLKNEIEIRNIFYKEEEMKNYIKSLVTRGQLTSFASLTYHLSQLGRNITGYDILIDTNISLIHQKLTNIEPIEQHPVIPPRILSELIDGLNLFVTDIYSYLSHIDEFIEAVTSCDNFARSNSLHVKKMIPLKDRPLNFKRAARKYELTELFVKYRVKNVSGLSGLISRIQHACRIYFHIYSGMRRSEVLSLKIDSLVERTMSFGSAFRFSGETSKLIGQRKKATWVTSREVSNAYQIVNTIAKRIGSYAGITTKNTPLFISAGYLGLTATKNIDIENIQINSAPQKSQECYEYLKFSNFIITDEDLNFLYKTAPGVRIVVASSER